MPHVYWEPAERARKLALSPNTLLCSPGPTHAAGEAWRVKTECFGETYKGERLAHAAIDFVVGDSFLDQLEGDIVANRERVEEGTLLKDEASAGSKSKQLLLGQARNVFAKEVYAALLRPKQPNDGLEQYAFAYARRSEQDAGLAWGEGEGDAAQYWRAIEFDGDVVKVDDREFVRRRGRRRAGWRSDGVHQEKMLSRKWVIRKSTKMMSTEEVTTA